MALAMSVFIFEHEFHEFHEYFFYVSLYCAHLIVTLAIAEVRLHLGNTQINLVFRSVCTNFVPETNDDAQGKDRTVDWHA